MGYEYAIKMLKEEKALYESEYCTSGDGTPDGELLSALDEAIKAVRFKKYFDELYGQGLEVVNWHQNGESEPFDNFYNSAIEYGEQE